MAGSDASLEGREIGGYRVEYKLGAGGMGAVFAAVEPTIGRRVAIKVLLGELAGDERNVARFEREARAVGLVRHPAVIDVFAFGKLEDGRPYFVMPLLEGKSLRQELASAGRIAPAEAWRIGREIVEGLAVAHRAGVLHRDLKPDNVFLSRVDQRKSQPVILDFGLAKWTDDADLDDRAKDQAKLTNTGVPMGTPIYMAPEQWWSRPVSHATDQYAFGVMLFELLAGRAPFDSQRLPELLQGHLHQKPPALRSLGVEVGEDIEAFVGRLLEKEPEGRYPDMASVMEAGDRAFHAAVSSGGELAGAATLLDSRPSRAAVEVRTPAAASTPRSGGLETLALARTEVSEPALSGPRSRAMAGYVGVVVGALALLVFVGYPGSVRHDVAAWLRNAGFGAPVIVLGWLIGLTLVPRVVRSAERHPWRVLGAVLVPALPALLGYLATYGGYRAVVAGSLDVEPMAAFSIMHMGRWELGTADFMGLAAGASLALGAATWIVLTTPSTPSRGLHYAGLGLFATACLGAALYASAGQLSPVFGLVVAAAAIALAASRVSGQGGTLAASTLSAALMARAVSTTRAEAAFAAAWADTSTRADRVDALMRAGADQRSTALTTWPFTALALALAVYTLTRLPTPRRGPVGAALCLAVLITLPPTFMEAGYSSRRAELRATLSEQLVLFAKLLPPEAETETLVPAETAPTLQVTPESVALNGRGAGRLSALDTEAGRQALAQPIVAALAAPSLRSEGRKVDLAVLADRDVPWARIEQVLAIAYDGGAREVDLLLTRGAQPVIPKDAPPEAGHLSPSDFAALPITIGAAGLSGGAETRFAEVVAELMRAHHDGSVAVRIPLR